MRRYKAARRCCNITTPNVISAKKDTPIITEYERGSRWAGWLFVAMFAVLSAGVVLFQW